MFEELKMLQYVVFLVLLTSGKFSHEALHVLDHEKSDLVSRCKKIYFTI